MFWLLGMLLLIKGYLYELLYVRDLILENLFVLTFYSFSFINIAILKSWGTMSFWAKLFDLSLICWYQLLLILLDSLFLFGRWWSEGKYGLCFCRLVCFHNPPLLWKKCPSLLPKLFWWHFLLATEQLGEKRGILTALDLDHPILASYCFGSW